MNTKTLNLISAITDALDLAFERDPNVLLYGEDCGYEGGVFRTTQGLQAKYGEHRVLDAPIAEAAMCGMGCGLAIYGKKPIVEIQFDGFSFPGFQQIFTQIARYRNRSRSRWSVPMVIRIPMGGGIRALEHHSEALEALFAHTPGLTVVYPSNPYDAKGLLLASIESPDPVLYLEPKKLYRAFKQEIPSGYYTEKIGEAKVLQEGKDLTLVSFGATLHECINALKDTNHSIELIDLRTIAPLDWKTVLASVKKTGRILIAHEAVKSFSVSSEIMARVAEECLFELLAPPARVTGYDIIVPYARGEAYHCVNATEIKKAIDKLMNSAY